MVSTEGWSWKAFPGHRNFWIGTDTTSNSWIIKQKGTWNAIREHIYADLAQTLGICTQSSVYVTLDKGSMPLLGEWHPDKTPCNVGIWKFDEHSSKPCDQGCPYHKLNSAETATARMNAWLGSGIRNSWDRVEAKFLGYLSGMFEPTQSLVTTAHLWVQIDNELTFSDLGFGRGRSCESVMRYIRDDQLFKIEGATKRMKELCSRISDVTDRDIDRIAKAPDEFSCRTRVARVRRHLLQLRRNIHLIDSQL